MSRRRRAIKRSILPDAKFGNLIVAKLINCLMFDGKKTIAENIVYQALEKFGTTVSTDPMEALETVILNIKPLIEVRSRRVGGATYQVPCDVRPARALRSALGWFINAARNRQDHRTMAGKLFAELVDAYGNKGGAVKKKEDTHKMADANKAFAHYNW